MLKRKDIIRDDNRDAQRNTQTIKTTLTKEEEGVILADDCSFQDAESEFSRCWAAWRAFYNDEKEVEPNMRKQQAVVKSRLRPEFDTDDQEVT